MVLLPDLEAVKWSKLNLYGAEKSLVWTQSESVCVILRAKSVAIDSFLLLQ